MHKRGLGNWLLVLDWTEPGDPPLTRLAPKGQKPIAPHLRAPCPARRKAYPTKIPRWAEAELIQWWREDYAEHALNYLVEAHRPMVVQHGSEVRRHGSQAAH